MREINDAVTISGRQGRSIYIGYDSVIGTSIADINLSDLMVVKANVAS